MRTRGEKDQSEYDIQEREAAFLEYVQKRLDDVKKYSQLGKDGMLTFFDLNAALMEYQNINLSLIAVHAIARNEYKKAEEAFEDWYAEKYLLIKDLEAPTTRGEKAPTQKEIEMMVRVKYGNEFKNKKHELNLKECQISLLRRLCESWASQNFILGHLSNNLQSEVAGLGVDK